MLSVANHFMQNISTVNVKTIIFYEVVLILLSAVSVLAINIPYRAMYGPMNLANIQAKSNSWNGFRVCFIGRLCVATVTLRTIAYVPCRSSLCASLVLTSVQKRYTHTHMVAHKSQRQTIRVNQNMAHLQRLASVAVLFHTCVKVSLNTVSVCVCSRH